jgi:two-component system, chemotaxis family, chemotaxis protein CheY
MRVLIVEDEPVSRKLLESMMKPYGECSTAENGEEAFEVFCTALETGRPFDLVLLDIMMPEVDGQEALEAIRDYEQEFGIAAENQSKIIMTTALDDGPSLYCAHAEGCTDYIVKPICRDKLLSILRRLDLVPSEAH